MAALSIGAYSDAGQHHGKHAGKPYASLARTEAWSLPGSNMKVVAALVPFLTVIAADPQTALPVPPADWLLQTGKHDGRLETLPSGVQYKVLQQRPQEQRERSHDPRDTYRCSYRAGLLGGEEFDSSHSRFGDIPVTFKREDVPAGWSDAVNTMRTGDTWVIYVPTELVLLPTMLPIPRELVVHNDAPKKPFVREGFELV
jgi:hypothetical protein